MRKDYLAIEDQVATLDEASFVEQYWTGQWRDRHQAPDVSRVARFDEYRVMAPYLAKLQRGSRILDGGCGMGEWTVYLAQQGFDVVGMDISADVVARLRDWFPDYRFERGDLRHTSYEDGTFDGYFSWGTFEHFENGLGECLEEARRLVRPGGWLFVSVPFHNLRLLWHDAGSPDWEEEVADPASGLKKPQRFYQWRLTRDELRRELEMHGFRVDRVEPIHKESGAGRFLQHDLPLFGGKHTRAYRYARRAFGIVLPRVFISHMILAVGQRR